MPVTTDPGRRHTSNFSVQKRVFEVEEAEKKRKKTDSERAKTLEQVCRPAPPCS